MPIIPEFLYDINHPDAPIEGPPRITTTTTTTPAVPVNPCPCEQNQNINFSTTAPLTEDCKFLNKYILIYVVIVFHVWIFFIFRNSIRSSLNSLEFVLFDISTKSYSSFSKENKNECHYIAYINIK